MVTKFKKPAGADMFIAAAIDTNINISTDTGIDTDSIYSTNTSIDTSKYPWSSQNKKSIKKKMFNLKINDYYLEIIRYLSNPEEGKSMQKVVQEIITRELDKRVKDIEN